jgi:sugar O-acyltransferase (sialic acid O-acetyltransferase NeuD family)
MTRVVIVGAGGHAQVIADAILSRSCPGVDLTLAGFLDDNPDLRGSLLLGARVLGSIGQLGEVEHDAIVLGIGDNTIRARLFTQLQWRGRQFVSVVHQRATLAADVQLGAGTVVFAGAVVNTGSIIGPNVIINTGATVDHHTQIGAHAHIAPGVHLGGAVSVGVGTLVGIGSSVMPGRSIGDWATVGAGAVVTKNVQPGQTVVGVPAKQLTT